MSDTRYLVIGTGKAHFGLLDLEHLLVLLLILLHRLVEEEVGRPQSDAVSSLAVRREDLLQLLECPVRRHAPALGQLQGDHIGVPAADGGRPLPPATMRS